MISVNKKSDCCGCWACENICPKQCIEMREDCEGFKYPIVDLEKCIDCHLCEKVCPEINSKPDVPKKQKAYILQHKDDNILRESTSGGAFTSIAQWVIEQGGVVFGAAFDHEFIVRHQFAETLDELTKFRNSKYVQSSIDNCFSKVKELLEQGRYVLFSGTPCQLEGLILFLRKPYERLITLDVMCKSVTSPGIFRKYVKEKTAALGLKPDKILFRDKRPYGYEYSQMSFYNKGKQIYHEGVETDEYLRSFFSDMNVRPSCYECSFKKQHHLTDFTIWDCFDVSQFDNKFDNNRGVTRVLANSDKAIKILKSIETTAKIKEIPLELAIKDTSEMFHSVKMPADRSSLFSALAHGKSLKAVYPKRTRNRLEKTLRVTLSRLGIYSSIKRNAKKVIKDLKRK